MRISLDTQYDRIIVEKKVLIDKDFQNHGKIESEGFLLRRHDDYEESNNMDNDITPLLVLNRKDVKAVIKALNFLVELE